MQAIGVDLFENNKDTEEKMEFWKYLVLQLKITSFKKISKVDLILETVDLFLSVQSTSLSVMRYYQQIHERNNGTFAIEELLIFDQEEEKSSSLKLNKFQTK